MSDQSVALQACLAQFREPNLGITLGEARALRAVAVNGAQADITLELPFPTIGYAHELQEALSAYLRHEGIGLAVTLHLASRIVAHAVQRNLRPLEGVKNVVAVASGKGGVGKSTVAVNLALALAAAGARVGLLDADIYGPSVPTMLGIAGQRPRSEDGKHLEPLEAHGIVAMSIGALVDQGQAVIWRGPMVTQALMQLVRDTRWGELDYLLVDMPPGTGDIQLTLAQQVPVAGALIVTTPQEIALADARRAHAMFEKVGVPVLGVVENMSVHVCSQCGHEEHIFDNGGGRRFAEQVGVALLGELPLNGRIRSDADGGTPTVVAEPDGPRAARFLQTARRLAAVLARRPPDRSHLLPPVRVENTAPKEGHS